jgi:hypothetical protein
VDQLATQSIEPLEIFSGAVDIATCLGVTGQFGGHRFPPHPLSRNYRTDSGCQRGKIAAGWLGHP